MPVTSHAKWYLALLIGIGIIVRAILWFNYEPILYHDTLLYTRLATNIQTLNFDDYMGDRTPGYSILFIIANFDYNKVWLIQLTMGLAISVILFILTWSKTQNIFFAFLMGLSYTLSLNHVFFEASMLTETLSTFLLILSLLLCETKRPRYAIVLGIIMAWAILNRLLMLGLAPVYLLFIGWHAPTRIKCLLGYGLPIFIAVFGWSLFNKIHLDYFGLSTLSGYNWVGHTGRFIEYLPDEEADIRDIYLKFQAIQHARGSETMVIWSAIPEMMQRTGLSFTQLSEKLGRISIQLILQHPLLFGQSVFQSWYKFWDPANYWLLEKFKSPRLTQAALAIWFVQANTWIVLKYPFWCITLYYLWLGVTRRFPNQLQFEGLLIIIVWVSSLIQAVAGGYGENHRYAIPFQPLMLYVILSVVITHTSRPILNLRTMAYLVCLSLLLIEGSARLIVLDRQLVNRMFGLHIALFPHPEASDPWDAPTRLTGRLAPLPDPLPAASLTHPLIQFDSLLGWSPAPNRQATLNGLTYTINVDGLRSNHRYTPRKPNGSLRLATFGACAVYGCDVSDSYTWQRQLEQMHPELEALNFGVAQYGLDQAYLRYQQTPSEADIVLIGLTEHDLPASYNRYVPFYQPDTDISVTKPIFVEGEDGLTLLHNPFDTLATLQTALAQPNQWLDQTCLHDLYCEANRYRTSPFDYFMSYRFLHTIVYESYHYHSPEPHLEPRLNFLIIAQFAQRVTADKKQPVVMIFPDVGSVQTHTEGRPTAYAPAVTLLRERGLKVIDLAPALAHAAATTGRPITDYYTPDKSNLNELGHYLVSQTVLAHLCQDAALTHCP